MNVIVFVELPDGGVNLAGELAVHGVEHFGPIERDDADVVLDVKKKVLVTQSPLHSLLVGAIIKTASILVKMVTIGNRTTRGRKSWYCEQHQITDVDRQTIKIT